MHISYFVVAVHHLVVQLISDWLLTVIILILLTGWWLILGIHLGVTMVSGQFASLK